jgi:hypothetical protein
MIYLKREAADALDFNTENNAQDQNNKELQ